MADKAVVYVNKSGVQWVVDSPTERVRAEAAGFARLREVEASRKPEPKEAPIVAQKPK